MAKLSIKKIGGLRTKVELFEAGFTQDPVSGDKTKALTSKGFAYAKIEEATASERFQAKQLNQDITHMVTIRRHPGVTDKKPERHWELKYTDLDETERTLTVETVRHEDRRNRFTMLMCEELRA